MTSGIVPLVARATEQTQLTPPPVLGLAEVGALLGMKRASVENRRGRDNMARRAGETGDHLFPIPDWIISGTPVWKPSTIRRWARRTGRMDEAGRPMRAKDGPRRD